MEGLITGQKIEKDRRLIKSPAQTGTIMLRAAGEDVPKERSCGLSGEKMLLVGSAFIGIAGGDRDCFNLEGLGAIIEEFGDLIGFGIFEQGAVDDHPMAGFARGGDRLDGAGEDAFAVDGLIVLVLHPIEMNGKDQPPMRGIVGEFFSSNNPLVHR